MKERRVGRFYLSREYFEDFPASVRLLWSGLIPLRVEHRYDVDGWECSAEGEIFEPVKEGCMPPLYDIVVESIKNDKDQTIGVLLKLAPQTKVAA